MTNVDQFESAFRAADKEVYRPHEVPIGSIAVICDLPKDEAAAYGESVRRFLSAIDAEDVVWTIVDGDAFRGVASLLELVDELSPSLVCSYRNLHSTGWDKPYSLGEELDVLTQVASAPVLVSPHPKADRDGWVDRGTARVMAVTDHLRGEHRLVDWATRITAPGGTLLLSHVEDEAVFDRYIDVISKIPAIDTDVARATIGKRLLKEAHDFVGSVRDALARSGVPITVEELVRMGRHLSEHKQIVAEHDVSLLVISTRDDDQLAMHGLAYPLAVELRETPMLML
jgi:hypothetical protein